MQLGTSVGFRVWVFRGLGFRGLGFGSKISCSGDLYRTMLSLFMSLGPEVLPEVLEVSEHLLSKA